MSLEVGLASASAIPPQVIPGSAIDTLLDSVAPSKNVINSFIFGNVLCQSFLIGSLSVLWGAVNGLQLVAHFVFLNILVPANILMVFDVFYTIGTFDIIPVEYLTDPIKNSLES